MSELHAVLSSPIVRRRLTAIVSRRVPGQDAEDIVQSVLCDALAAEAPGEAIPKWLFGIARNKVADFHRRSKREDHGDVDVPVESNAIEARDMLRVAEAIAPDRKALEWIARGDSLEEIAATEKLSAPAVRQRVSRLRRALRAALMVAAALAVLLLVHAGRKEGIQPEPDKTGASLDGSWVVVQVDCAGQNPACLGAWYATVTVHGNTASVRAGGTHADVPIDALVREHHARIVRDGALVRVQADLGTVTLAPSR